MKKFYEDDPEKIIYIAKIPRKATYGEIRKLFNKFGNIVHLYVGFEDDKTYAFLHYDSKKTVQKVLRKTVMCRGQTLVLRPKQKPLGEDEIVVFADRAHEVSSQCNDNQVVTTIIRDDRTATITRAEEQSLAYATNGMLRIGYKRPVVARRGSNSVVRIDNLPFDWGADDLYHHLKNNHVGVKAAIVYDDVDARNMRQGLLQLRTPQEARALCESGEIVTPDITLNVVQSAINSIGPVRRTYGGNFTAYNKDDDEEDAKAAELGEAAAKVAAAAGAGAGVGADSGVAGAQGQAKEGKYHFKCPYSHASADFQPRKPQFEWNCAYGVPNAQHSDASAETLYPTYKPLFAMQSQYSDTGYNAGYEMGNAFHQSGAQSGTPAGASTGAAAGYSSPYMPSGTEYGYGPPSYSNQALAHYASYGTPVGYSAQYVDARGLSPTRATISPPGYEFAANASSSQLSVTPPSIFTPSDSRPSSEKGDGLPCLFEEPFSEPNSPQKSKRSQTLVVEEIVPELKGNKSALLAFMHNYGKVADADLVPIDGERYRAYVTFATSEGAEIAFAKLSASQDARNKLSMRLA